jgi:hypothetical protein
MLYNEKMKGDVLGEKNFWFCNLPILQAILPEDKFSWHPLSFSNCNAPSPLVSVCAQQVKRQRHNKRLREKNQNRHRRQ